MKQNRNRWLFVVFCFFAARGIAVLALRGATDEDAGSGAQADLRPCHAPAYSDARRIQKNATDDEREKLVNEGRCYLRCTTEKFKESVSRNEDNLIPYWPYITVDSGCSITQKVHECVRGCFLRSSLAVTSRICANTCSTNCDAECNGMSSCENPDSRDPWIHQGCDITCDTRDRPCPNGCLLTLSANESLVPRDPISPPDLTHIATEERVGQYSVDLRPASPHPRRGGQFNQSAIDPVGFLFMIELLPSHNISFTWITDPSSHLDLADYACHDISISFAVANKYGISIFSEQVQVTVESAMLVPHPPTSLRISTEIDKRVGFFGHAVVNISWDQPLNSNYLDRYEVVISTNLSKCGPSTRNQTTDVTSVLVMANTVTDLPWMGCVYTIQVFSVGMDGKSEPLQENYTVPHFDPECILFQCDSFWNHSTNLFSFNFTWTTPPYLRHGNIINRFEIVFMMENEPPITDPEYVAFPQDAPAVFSTTITANDTPIEGRPYYMPHNNDGRTVSFEMSVVWTRSFIYTYQPPDYTYTCQVSTLALAPTNVQNLTVESYCLNMYGDEIWIDLTWSPPATFNGVSANYNVCIGSEALEPDQSIAPHDPAHVCTSEALSADATYANVTILYRRPRNGYLYLQIRANNMYASGNWSEPCVIPVPIDSDLIECNPETFGNETSDNLTEATTKSDMKVHNPTRNARSVGIIAGSVLGGLTLTIVIGCTLCLIVCCVRNIRERKSLMRITQDFSCEPMYNSGPKTLLLRQTTVNSLMSPQRDDWEIPANEVIIEDSLGEGAFGEVFKGVVKCPITNPKVKSTAKNAFCTPVAIKLLKTSAKGNERQDFLSEIEMMKKVAEGQNPHVVCLLGCVTIQEPLCLITEFVKYGDLLSYLRTNRRMCLDSSAGEDEENDAYLELGNVSSMDLISFAYQISSGMEYLSSLGIVHRDLACRNILVDEGKVLKITDFGMSRETDEIYVQKRTGRVPLKWMAIESIIAREFTSASDVWSYGITLWEIGTLGGFPYPSIQNEDLLSLLKGGYRMEKPDNCSPEVYDIMLACWNGEPQNRPTFTDLRSKFDAMLVAERKDAYIDLRIDNDKPYYRLDTMATLAVNGAHVSPNLSHRSLHSTKESPFVTNGSGSKECSPKPSLSTTISPCHLSSQDGCCSSQASPRKPSDTTGTSMSSLNRKDLSPRRYTCEQTRRSSDTERRRRDGNHSQGRPVSMLLPGDRERNEKQNPYVEEPSRAAATSLAPPGSHGHSGSDGAIERRLNQFESRVDFENANAGIEITIIGVETEVDGQGDSVLT